MEKHYKLAYIGLHPPILQVEGPGILPTAVPVMEKQVELAFLALLDKVYEAGLTRGRNEVEEPRPRDTQAINPAHYKVGGIECIDYLKAKLSAEEFRGFLKGNAVKYLSRAEHKGNAEDYAKANWYTNMLAGKDPRN
jgi:hypothetical protein